MNRADALRHSLLRIISELPDSALGGIERKRLANTLHVETDGPHYRVKWCDGKRTLAREYRKNDFIFFKRGDLPGEGGQALASMEEINHESMAKIVRDMLGSQSFQLPPRLPPPALADRRPVTIGLWPWLLLLTIVIFRNQPPAALLAGILMMMALLERFRYSLLAIGYLGIAILPWQGLPFSAFFGFFGILAIAILSPRDQGRPWQVAGAVLVFLSFGLSTIYGQVTGFPPLDWAQYVAAIVCLIAILIGWKQGINVYLVPLVFPLFGLGAILDGYSTLALILGGLLIARAIVLGLYPRRARSLLS